MKIDQLKNNIIKEINKTAPELKRISRDIFNHPETAFNEFYAQKVLTEYLEAKGIKVKREIGGIKTAFKAEITGTGQGPVVALIAEYDALPELGHACGHNIVCTASIGALVVLNKFLDTMDGKVFVIGTPGEEGGGGKIILIKKGVFRNIDVAMMIHPSNKNKVIRRMLAVQELKFRFTGRAAHASAHPDRGLNALDAVILTFNNINALRQQTRDDARIHGIITEGGTAPNIIPDRASARFYVRAMDIKYLRELVKRVKRCAEAAATATGTRLRIDSSPSLYKPFLPNYTLGGIFSRNLLLLGIKEDNIPEREEMGSSDIGNLSHELATLHADISICTSSTACHTADFAEAAVSEDGMNGILTGTKALALTVVDIIHYPENMKRIKEEFIKISQISGEWCP